MFKFARPQMECLEDRQCLSTMLEVTQQGHNLRVTGNDEWNVVQIVQDDAHDRLTIIYGQLPHNATQAALVVNTQVYRSSSINKITVDLGLGDDNVEYTLAPNSDLLYAKDLTISTGAGNDCVTIDTTNPMYDSSSASLIEMPSIRASQGVMTADGEWLVLDALQSASISSTYNPVMRAALNVTVNTGTGNDLACVSLGSVREGLKVGFSFDLDDGQDQFWLCNYGTIAKNATVNLTVNGGADKDAICLGSYGNVVGTLNLNAKGGTGDDSFFSDLQGVNDGKTSLSIDTGAGNDVVTLNQNLAFWSLGTLLISPIR